jgi:hypothetical protein
LPLPGLQVELLLLVRMPLLLHHSSLFGAQNFHQIPLGLAAGRRLLAGSPASPRLHLLLQGRGRAAEAGVLAVGARGQHRRRHVLQLIWQVGIRQRRVPRLLAAGSRRRHGGGQRAVGSCQAGTQLVPHLGIIQS